MANVRTAVSEIVTGLGLLGFRDLERALADRPLSITHVDEASYDRLDEAFASGKHRNVFDTAWSTGQRFARATDGLRGRPPRLVEWKGPHKPPAYELIPADLRVDHVYLISCKYGSNILQNASPWNLFDRALVDRQRHSYDWFAEVAPRSYQEFYRRVCDHVGETAFPTKVVDLDGADRKQLSHHLPRRWPAELLSDWKLVSSEIARESASRLLAQLTTTRLREEFLWRILRLQSAPYFVLGADRGGNELCYRVTTPWDFRARYTLRTFDIWGDSDAGQPLVRWRADVRDKESATDRVIDGHVEVRWSHGKFGGFPEAKIYLDTPHHDVAGYQPLAES